MLSETERQDRLITYRIAMTLAFVSILFALASLSLGSFSFSQVTKPLHRIILSLLALNTGITTTTYFLGLRLYSQNPELQSEYYNNPSQKPIRQLNLFMIMSFLFSLSILDRIGSYYKYHRRFSTEFSIYSSFLANIVFTIYLIRMLLVLYKKSKQFSIYREGQNE